MLGIGPMLLHRLARRLPVFRVTPETMGLVVFGAVIIATAPFSVWPGGAIEVFTDNYLKIVIVFVLMMNTLTTTSATRAADLAHLSAASGFVAALGVSNYARGDQPHRRRPPRRPGRRHLRQPERSRDEHGHVSPADDRRRDVEAPFDR